LEGSRKTLGEVEKKEKRKKGNAKKKKEGARKKRFPTEV